MRERREIKLCCIVSRPEVLGIAVKLSLDNHVVRSIDVEQSRCLECEGAV